LPSSRFFIAEYVGLVVIEGNVTYPLLGWGLVVTYMVDLLGMLDFF
jgi:hypothetical protein